MNPTDAASRADLDDQRALGTWTESVLPRTGAVSVTAFDRVIAAVDAPHYLLTSHAVGTRKDAAEVADSLVFAGTGGEPVTFRSGGTSLSGQAATRDILVDTRRHFRRMEVLDDGPRVRVGMTPATRHSYQHVLEVLDWVAAPFEGSRQT